MRMSAFDNLSPNKREWVRHFDMLKGAPRNVDALSITDLSDCISAYAEIRQQTYERELEKN